MRAQRNRSKRNSGIALLTTLLLLLLMSSLLVGFIILVMGGQQLSAENNDQTRAFYGAEAGMEKMTADLGTLFNSTYSPTSTQLANIQLGAPNIFQIQYLAPNGTAGYILDYPGKPSAPVANNLQINAGPYKGMVGLGTPYTLTVTTRTSTGAEVMLRRTTQTVGIPAFQFGVFSDTDLSFHAGPAFNFGGRVHTNGNLFLAEGSGNTLTLSDKVTVYKDVIRTNIANGLTIETGNWTGTVNISTGAGMRALDKTEGSLLGTVPSPPTPANPNWPTISQSYYNSNLINGTTGVQSPLNLANVVLSKGASGPVDIIRRPIGGEDASNPDVLGQRYFAQASMKILLSDDPQDIMKLPCIDGATQPVDLRTLAVQDPGSPSVSGYTTTLPAWYTTSNPNPVPLATSAAGTSKTSATAAPPATGYTTSGNGYWLPKYEPVITGFLKIEIQIGYNSPCGKWQDVTQEILKLGVAGRNLNPNVDLSTYPYPNVPPLPGVQIGPSPCPDPNPNAVIRLERVRDNPSNPVNGQCGVDSAMPPTVFPNKSTDYWPNVLFDTREGTFRDNAPGSGLVMLGGVMHYVELDVKNLARYFSGTIGTTGQGAMDPSSAPYNFAVYFSDRRGNYISTPVGGGWPPASPATHETGEYGFTDFVNPSDGANGCPNGTLDAGEDLAVKSLLYTYGQAQTASVTSRFFGDALPNATSSNPNCAGQTSLWPGAFVNNAQEARINPPLFFRRALKLVNGNNINKYLSPKLCPGNVVCGLTIASENPIYVQGDYNANSSTGGFGDPHVATSVVGDAVTLLSNNFSDVNSLASPYNLSRRNANTTWYRTAVLAGKGAAFPWISGTSTDTGSDGGVHNFLRYIENWGGQTLNYRGSIISMFYNRQAIGIFKCCATVYSPPSRGYNFDVEFLQPSLLPPRTPMFRDINTTGFTQLIYPEQK
ncbi:MAG TPA: hypothetical protein VOA41_04860 [Candidatus Dormibacteraeota bacterium]|nr:hypothetical protein [Candidatus Dormibacteraeota bacterium]